MTKVNVRAHKNRNRFMPPHVHFGQDSWMVPVSLTLTLFFAALLYLRGWIRLRSSSASSIPPWRACSFFIGLTLVWAALVSPFAAYDHSLLTAHMIKHLLLMTFAPAFILLGEPVKAFWNGTPPSAQNLLRRTFPQHLAQWLERIATNLALGWTVSALTLILWHLPVLFTLSMRSEFWHTFEEATFFGAGLLFWWPVIEPWPTTPVPQRWSLLLYLFLATLPCDILSGFLVFSDRVAYPVYLSAPRLFGFSVLEDQQCAAALMWTCVTIVYLVAGAILSTE